MIMEQWITLVLIGYMVFKLHKIEKAIKLERQITITPVYETTPVKKEEGEKGPIAVVPPINATEQYFSKLDGIDSSFDEDFAL